MKRKLVGMLLGATLSLTVVGCDSNIGGTNEATDIVVTTQETGEGETEKQAVSTEMEMEGASYISLSDAEITVDGDVVTTDTEATVYVANDIVYYEEGKDFTYGEGTEADAHSKEEAEKHTVVHITKPGTYVLSGKLEAGQIAVDLGEDARDDSEAVVTLVLNGADITCTVAPGVIFYNVYECCSSDDENATKDVDTTSAGANVIIADGTVNTVNGSYVAKIYESVELNEDGTEVVDSKKLHKYDGAFYSKMSININGGEENNGILNIHAENEGLDSELHLTINGGQINIVSGNDGINTNEDNVSVTTINGGFLNIGVDGSTGEGDGIDSNGWLVINGGVVNASACATSGDAGIDSDKGIHINGGTVIASGNMLDHIAASEQSYVVFRFQDKVKGGEEISIVKDEESHFVSMPNDFTYLLVSKASFGEGGIYTLWKGEEQLNVVEMDGNFGTPGMMPGGFGGEMPERFEAGEMPEGMEPGEVPDGMKMPEEAGREETAVPESLVPGETIEGMERGERTEKPEGMEPGERSEMPEGLETDKMPGGGRGGKGFGQMNMEDAVTEFEIKDGGNMFMVVSNRNDFK